MKYLQHVHYYNFLQKKFLESLHVKYIMYDVQKIYKKLIIINEIIN